MDLLSFLLPRQRSSATNHVGGTKRWKRWRDGDGDGVRIHENEREQETTRAVNNWIHMLQKISKDSVVMS